MDLSDLLKGALGGGQPGGGGVAGASGGRAGLGNLVPAVLEMLGSRGGGLAGLVESFGRSGLGDVVSSWIGTGPNLPVSAEQVTSAFDGATLEELARKAGLPADSIGSALSGVLPGLVDGLTPDGKLPEGDLLKQGGDLLSKLGLSPGG